MQRQKEIEDAKDLERRLLEEKVRSSVRNEYLQKLKIDEEARKKQEQERENLFQQ